MTGYVYILRSQKNNSYYIGSTCEPARRLEEHNKNQTKYTKNLIPWDLVFVQEFSDIKEARQIEFKLKRLKRKDIIEKIINEGVIRLRL